MRELRSCEFRKVRDFEFGSEARDWSVIFVLLLLQSWRSSVGKYPKRRRENISSASQMCIWHRRESESCVGTEVGEGEVSVFRPRFMFCRCDRPLGVDYRLFRNLRSRFDVIFRVPFFSNINSWDRKCYFVG